MYVPRVTRHTSMRYSSCRHTRVSVCGDNYTFLLLIVNVGITFPLQKCLFWYPATGRGGPRGPRGPGRLRPRIFSTFGTTRVVGRQPNAPAALTPGEIPGTHFQRLSRPTWFCQK